VLAAIDAVREDRVPSLGTWRRSSAGGRVSPGHRPGSRGAGTLRPV